MFAALLFWLYDKRPQVIETGEDKLGIAYMLLLLLFIGSSLVLRRRALPIATWARYGLVWTGVALVLVGGYSYRSQINSVWSRTLAVLMPGYAVQLTPGTVIVGAGEDRHFRVDATVDGAAIQFLVDTGATSVVLNRHDARRIGFTNDTLSFTRRTETANGIGLGAPVRLREIRVGEIVVRDIRALVNQAPMSSSLLGINFLERLSGYSVKDGLLTLQR